MSSTSTAANQSVESVTHEENEVNTNPYAEVTAAVLSELHKSKDEVIKNVQEQVDQKIEAAVKRALDSHEELGSSKKQKKEHEFKREGNKIRYNVNEEILEKIESGIKAIGRNDLEAAKNAMEGGKAIVTKQQKLIRLADREDNGWEVVKHYLSDDLAE